MLIARQQTEKFPATSPDKMFSDGRPSREEVTTSATWAESVEVKTFTNSGIIAPARVPHEMINESCHQRSLFPPSVGMVSLEITKVITTETIDVIHTRDVSGDSNFITAVSRMRD